MRCVQVRRHSLTKKEETRGSHLSQEGVELARATAAGMGTFDLVIASKAPRTVETALAMGFSVEDVISYPDVTDGTGIDFHAWWEWPAPFDEVAAIFDRNERAARAGASIADAWSGIAESVKEDGRALVVSHGGVMEVGLVAAITDADRSDWGAPFQQCDGFELDYDGAGFTAVRFFRR